MKTFVTLRVAGDRLDPDEVTRILKTTPTQAYAKGADYAGGPRSSKLVGKTGVWFFSTDRVVASDRLADHLAFLVQAVLVPGWVAQKDQLGLPPLQRLLQLRDLMQKKALRAVVTAFWHGKPGARRPSVPRPAIDLLKLVPIETELDFDTDEEPAKSRIAAGRG